MLSWGRNANLKIKKGHHATLTFSTATQLTKVGTSSCLPFFISFPPLGSASQSRPSGSEWKTQTMKK